MERAETTIVEIIIIIMTTRAERRGDLHGEADSLELWGQRQVKYIIIIIMFCRSYYYRYYYIVSRQLTRAGHTKKFLRFYRNAGL